MAWRTFIDYKPAVTQVTIPNLYSLRQQFGLCCGSPADSPCCCPTHNAEDWFNALPLWGDACTAGADERCRCAMHESPEPEPEQEPAVRSWCPEGVRVILPTNDAARPVPP